MLSNFKGSALAIKYRKLAEYSVLNNLLKTIINKNNQQYKINIKGQRE